MRRFLVAAAAGAALLTTATPAFGAVEVNGFLTASPNPGTVGSPVTVANQGTSSCEGGGVAYLSIEDPVGGMVVNGMAITPDGSGNWSYPFTPTMTGTYNAWGECLYPEVVEAAQPAAFPPIYYGTLAIQVQAPGTTAPGSTSSTQASTSTTATAAANVTPAFTG